MRYVFINQSGVLGDYAKPFKTTRTGFKRVQDMQIALEQTLKMYSNLPATAENAESLWTSLDTVARQAVKEMFKPEMECDAFLEIESWLGQVGEALAWGSQRKGISYQTRNEICSKFFYKMDGSEPEFINTYLQMMLCTITNKFNDKEAADAFFAHIDDMSDEEIMEMALKDKERVKYANAEKQTVYSSYDNEVEEIPF